MKKINLFGIGGHYKVVKEIAIQNKYEIINLYDDNTNKFNHLIEFKGNLHIFAQAQPLQVMLKLAKKLLWDQELQLSII